MSKEIFNDEQKLSILIALENEGMITAIKKVRECLGYLVDLETGKKIVDKIKADFIKN